MRDVRCWLHLTSHMLVAILIGAECCDHLITSRTWLVHESRYDLLTDWHGSSEGAPGTIMFQIISRGSSRRRWHGTRGPPRSTEPTQTNTKRGRYILIVLGWQGGSPRSPSSLFLFLRFWGEFEQTHCRPLPFLREHVGKTTQIHHKKVSNKNRSKRCWKTDT